MFEKAENSYAVCYTDAQIDGKESINPSLINASAEILYYYGDTRSLTSGSTKEWKDIDDINRESSLMQCWSGLVAARSREEVRLWHYETSQDPAETSREEERLWIYTRIPQVKRIYQNTVYVPKDSEKRQISVSPNRPISIARRTIVDDDMGQGQAVATSDASQSVNSGANGTAKKPNANKSIRERLDRSASNSQKPMGFDFLASTKQEDKSVRFNVNPFGSATSRQQDYSESSYNDFDCATGVSKHQGLFPRSEDPMTTSESQKGDNLFSEATVPSRDMKANNSIVFQDEENIIQSGPEEDTKSPNLSIIGGVKLRPKPAAMVNSAEHYSSLASSSCTDPCKEKTDVLLSEAELEPVKADDEIITSQSAIASSNVSLDETPEDPTAMTSSRPISNAALDSSTCLESEQSGNVDRPYLFKPRPVPSGSKRLFQSDIDEMMLSKLQNEKLRYRRNPFSLIDLSNAVPSDSLVGAWNVTKRDLLTRVVPHGKGRLMTADGKLIYLGEFSNGKRHGFGSALITTSDDSYTQSGHYQGNWKNNCRHGTGCMTYLSGRQYNGQWYLDHLNGSGILSFPDGSVLKGNFGGGMPDGGFTYYSSEGFTELRDYWNGQLMSARLVEEMPLDEEEYQCDCEARYCGASNIRPKISPPKEIINKDQLAERRPGNLDFGTVAETYMRTFRKETAFFIKRQLSEVKIACEEMLLNAKDELTTKVQLHKNEVNMIHLSDVHQEKNMLEIDLKVDLLASRLDAMIDLCRSMIDKQEQSEQTLSSLSLNVAELPQMTQSNSHEMDNKSLRKKIKNLESKAEKNDHLLKCQICHEKRQDCILMPCMHMETCSICIASIRRVENHAKCPICRAVIQGKVIRKLPSDDNHHRDRSLFSENF